MRWGHAAASVLVLVLLPAFAFGVPVNPSLFQDLRWRLIGPFRGGRVLAVSGVPGEPDHFYFGSVNGGVWESRNAGRTWRPIFDSVAVGSISRSRRRTRRFSTLEPARPTCAPTSPRVTGSSVRPTAE